jgi:hypothetical protein
MRRPHTTAGTVFMGLTLKCARCHDHKYDPLTQKEFYSAFRVLQFRSMRRGYFRDADADPLMKAPTKAQQAQLQRSKGMRSAGTGEQGAGSAGRPDALAVGTATSTDDGSGICGADHRVGRAPAAR